MKENLHFELFLRTYLWNLFDLMGSITYNLEPLYNIYGNGISIYYKRQSPD